MRRCGKRSAQHNQNLRTAPKGRPYFYADLLFLYQAPSKSAILHGIKQIRRRNQKVCQAFCCGITLRRNLAKKPFLTSGNVLRTEYRDSFLNTNCQKAAFLPFSAQSVLRTICNARARMKYYNKIFVFFVSSRFKQLTELFQSDIFFA